MRLTHILAPFDLRIINTVIEALKLNDDDQVFIIPTGSQTMPTFTADMENKHKKISATIESDHTITLGFKRKSVTIPWPSETGLPAFRNQLLRIVRENS